MGSYINEVRIVVLYPPVRIDTPCPRCYSYLQNNPGEPDWQHSFWGDNYDRLVKIKRQVDPLDTLWCQPCVGNERWKEVGYQLCRVGGY
jgi:hypothetical protein